MADGCHFEKDKSLSLSSRSTYRREIWYVDRHWSYLLYRPL